MRLLLLNSSGSLAIFAAIRRASSDLILIKLPIDPLWFCEPLGGGHEAFAHYRGAFAAIVSIEKPAEADNGR